MSTFRQENFDQVVEDICHLAGISTSEADQDMRSAKYFSSRNEYYGDFSGGDETIEFE